MSILELKDLAFSYPGNPVLSDISLAFAPGALTGVIGPNGAGKTTLLRLISGYLTPTAGRVLVNGAPVSTYRPKELARLMALVPQRSALGYDFKVRDVVLTGRNAYLKNGFSRDSADDVRIAADAMEKAGISHLAGRSVLTLSGGELQRMLIARAVCQQSAIILLDEPVASLDIANQSGVMGMVRALTAALGVTGVCVMHDLSLTMNYCDYVAVIAGGGLVACGPPRQVITSKLIEEVYGARATVREVGGCAYVLQKMN